MTHAEMYEIVKGHRDVWGEHFHTVRRGDESTEFVRHFTNDAPEPEHLEAELLGLGVVWLAIGVGEFMHGADVVYVIAAYSFPAAAATGGVWTYELEERE